MPGTTTGSSTRDVQLIPYVEVDGIRTFKDSEIIALYDRTVRDGTAKALFHDGEIGSAKEFLTSIKFGENRLFVVLVLNEIAGVFWLNRFKGRSCYVHFTTFSHVWGKNSVEVGRAAIRKAMHMATDAEGYTFDVLLGLIPSWNQRAIRWTLDVGFEACGDIPNAIWDSDQGKSVQGTLMYLTREIMP